MKRLFGMLFFFTFAGVWMLGAFIGVLALIEPFFLQSYFLTCVLILYFSYRSVVPKAPWSAFRNFTSAWCAKYPYFESQRVVFDEPTLAQSIAPNSKSLLCFHPHGILCVGYTVLGNHAAFFNANIQWLVTDIMTKLPFVSDFILWLSGGSVTKHNMLRAMQRDQNLAMLPGGFEEATIFQKGEHRVYLKHRKGFIKYALQYGYTVHPAYIFGEEETYYTMNVALEWRLWLNQYKIPTVFFWGHWLCFFLPRAKTHLTTVVGPGLAFPKRSNPTEAEICHHHQRYVEALQALFEKYKPQYARDTNATLHIH